MKTKLSTKLFLGALLLLALGAASATPSIREKIQVVYQGSPANYQIYIFGGSALRCRGSNLHISRDERGDGDGPIIVECR